MGTLVRFVTGLAVGTAIGTGATILLAPQSGKQFQSMLRARRDAAIRATRNEAADRERELRAEWEAKKNARKIMHDALRG